jgi:hypothetical protein
VVIIWAFLITAKYDENLKGYGNGLSGRAHAGK